MPKFSSFKRFCLTKFFLSLLARVGLMHIGVFILLLLSGERNFGVRLNKPYTATVPMDIPVFTGSHADLLITVFHKIITTGHQRLQPLFDCLLTILVNGKLIFHFKFGQNKQKSTFFSSFTIFKNVINGGEC